MVGQGGPVVVENAGAIPELLVKKLAGGASPGLVEFKEARRRSEPGPRRVQL